MLKWLKRKPRLPEEERAVTELVSKLRSLAPNPDDTARIQTLSFGHFAEPDEPFPFHAAIALRAARRHHPAARTLLFAETQPRGQFWDMVAGDVQFVPFAPFERYGSTRMSGGRDRLRIVRLLTLYHLGGLFAATDMVVMSNMDEFARSPLVLGVEASIPVGRFAIGEGMALGTRDNPLCGRWLDALAIANLSDSTVDRRHYAARLPVRLYVENPQDAVILPHNAWFAPHPRHIVGVLFNSDKADEGADLIEGQYALPLWADVWAEHLADWTPERLSDEDCLFARLCRSVLTTSSCGQR